MSHLSKIQAKCSWHIQADFTSTSALLFASFLKQVLVQKVSYENGLIFMQMKVQVTYFHTNSFAQRLILAQRQK